MRQDELNYSTTVQSPGWLIAEPMDQAIAQQVCDFNMRGLRLQLAGLEAASCARRRELVLPRALQDLLPVWRAMDAVALRRLASMPFLLFELGLDSVPLFARGGSRAVALPEAAAQLEFANLVISYAWHLARANPLGAAVGLGMPTQCAAILKEMNFGDLQSCVPSAAACLRLRWCERPAVWRTLLAAVNGGDRTVLEREQLAGLRRLAGDLLTATLSGGAGRVAEPLW